MGVNQRGGDYVIVNLGNTCCLLVLMLRCVLCVRVLAVVVDR